MTRRGADGKSLPGFLVCDVFAGSVADEQVVAGFIRKCQMLGAMKRIAPLLPVMMADLYTPEALRVGRSQGVMMTTPENLFGQQIAKGLHSLLDTLTRAAAMAVYRPEILVELFDSLGKIEGAAANLRGALFELLVGHCVVQNDTGNIDIGKEIVDRTTGTRAEIDVFRVHERREVIAYECKGYQATGVVSLDEVKHWLENRVPFIHRVNAAEPRFAGVAFSYEFWTSGSFADDALAYLRDRAEKIKKYGIAWKDGADVRRYVVRTGLRSLVKMYDEHYGKHPLAVIDEECDTSTWLRPIKLDDDVEKLTHAAVPALTAK